jgi:hypothetical protein
VYSDGKGRRVIREGERAIADKGGAANGDSEGAESDWESEDSV